MLRAAHSSWKSLSVRSSAVIFCVFQCSWWPVSLLCTWDPSTSNTSVTKLLMWVQVEELVEVWLLVNTLLCSCFKVCVYRVCPGWTGERRPCDVDRRVFCQLVSRVPVLRFSVRWSLSQVRLRPSSAEMVSSSAFRSNFSASVLWNRYNCAGLKFGKVDIGRYGEVSKK